MNQSTRRKHSPTKSRHELEEWLARRSRRVLGIMKDIPGLKRKLGTRPRIDLSLTTRSAMQKLNSEFRKKNKPTDVLSFPSPEVFFSQGELGSIAICLDVARAQARERDYPIEIELEVLLVHGVLHLLGFDHEDSQAEAKKMAGLERKVLRRSLSARDQAKFKDGRPHGLVALEQI